MAPLEDKFTNIDLEELDNGYEMSTFDGHVNNNRPIDK
jgi:hypothetical protein